MVAAAPVGAPAAPSAQGSVVLLLLPGMRLRLLDDGDQHGGGAADDPSPAVARPAGGRGARSGRADGARPARATRPRGGGGGARVGHGAVGVGDHAAPGSGQAPSDTPTDV